MLSPKIISSQVQCIYRNESNYFQVIRVEDDRQWIERTLAAGQVLQFEACRNAYVDVYTYEMATMVHSDRISCSQLTDPTQTVSCS